MSKKALQRLATSICFTLCVLFLGHITVLADEVKPVHEYTFDNDPVDKIATPNGYPAEYEYFYEDSGIEGGASGCRAGTYNMSFVTGYNGKGKAAHFDNTTKMYLGYKAMPKGAKSIRFKIKKDAASVNNEITEPILSTITDKYNGYYIGIGALNNDSEPGSLFILNQDNNNKINFEIHTSESICDGRWHDVLFTWDGTTNSNSIKLYVDNMTVPVSQLTPVSTENYTTTAFGVGFQNYSLIEKNKLSANKYFWGDLDELQFYASAITPSSETSSNLKATGGDSRVDLTWNPVTDATSYTVKRSTTAGGPYTTIVTGITGTTYTDTGVTNGTTYYYVVTAIVNGSEGWNSNEASATPQASTDPNQSTGNKALLVITMVTGERKEYEMTTDKINDFIAWYNSKGASGPTYVIEKDYNKASFTTRKDYITYEQISNFEVNEYNN
ncbi:hypothetical protein DS742_05105 [Lacrimispora amygdalina]|uniref:Fibronectin type-III domain-containing protein n=1 Tax=Lacrimispora amygdalina TaxID=253257 RepID=A0A3E2NG22_9FIRM|nr:LamG-like jellyroll fold domain-containing protein [Clostridium indicum]RFZ79840.1 hypothetical protein DS742_05105 [Clostridium indicum]